MKGLCLLVIDEENLRSRMKCPGENEVSGGK
jgi:hypothetical protein